MGTPVKMTLTAARPNVNMNQSEAGKAIGVSENVISNWERGISFPDALQLKRIEEVYGVGYDNLIFLPKQYGLTV